MSKFLKHYKVISYQETTSPDYLTCNIKYWLVYRINTLLTVFYGFYSL